MKLVAPEARRAWRSTRFVARKGRTVLNAGLNAGRVLRRWHEHHLGSCGAQRTGDRTAGRRHAWATIARAGWI